MRKRIFTMVAGIVLCATAITSYNAYESQGMSKDIDLMAKNIEALTQDEYDSSTGCRIWPYEVCYGVVVTPGGNSGIDWYDRRN